jgi:hypothetical protein
MWRLLTWLGLAFVAVVGAHFVVNDGEVALEFLDVSGHPLAVCLQERNGPVEPERLPAAALFLELRPFALTATDA